MKYYLGDQIKRWERHVSRMGVRRVANRFRWGDLRERNHLEDPGIDGKIILTWMLGKWDGWAWTGLIWLKIGTVGGQ
jgi:hypothetical protein